MSAWGRTKAEPPLSLRKKGANGFPSRPVLSLYQFVASPCASSAEDIASIQGAHTLTETVYPLVTAVMRLKSSFHDIRSWVRRTPFPPFCTR